MLTKPIVLCEPWFHKYYTVIVTHILQNFNRYVLCFIGDVCNNNKLLQTYGQKSGGHKFTGDAGSAATRSHGYKFASCLMMIVVSCLAI